MEKGSEEARRASETGWWGEKGCVPSRATPTTMKRDGEQRGRVRHDNGPCLHTRKLADAEKAATVSAWDKNCLKRKKKQSKGKRLIGGHALTTTNIVTLALIRKDSLFSNKTITRLYIPEILTTTFFNLFKTYKIPIFC